MLANFLNKLGIAFIVTGFIVPAITGQFASGSKIAVGFCWIAFGVGLHCGSHIVLERLRS